MNNKKKFANQLLPVRQRLHLQQKQVAKLLGHKKAESLSRYENGTKIPSLKTALKLAIIYDIPLRVMLDGYYEACRAEIARQEQTLGRRSVSSDARSRGYCSFEERLKTELVKGSDLRQAHKHTLDLMRLRGENLSHLPTFAQ